MKNSTINLKCNPYRGIMQEVSRELGISVSAVNYGWQMDNPVVVDTMNRHIRRRQAIIAEKRRLINAPSVAECNY